MVVAVVISSRTGSLKWPPKVLSMSVGNDFNLSFQNSTSDSSNTFSLPNTVDDRAGPPATDLNSTGNSPLADATNNTNEQNDFFLAPVCDPVQSDKLFAAAETTDQPSTFQTEFNAFETDDTSANAGSADWVNFDQVDSSAWADPVSTAPASVQATSILAKQPDTVQTSTLNSNDQTTVNTPAAVENNDDDEWSDFAEPKPFEFKPSIPAPVLVAPPRPAIVNPPAPVLSKSSPLTGQMLIDLDGFLEQIFAKTPASLLAEQDETTLSNRVPTDFPTLIDEDLVWQHIQRFTTETDASDSLQFKWKLSDLESSFLSSLCLQRAPSLVKATHYLHS